MTKAEFVELYARIHYHMPESEWEILKENDSLMQKMLFVVDFDAIQLYTQLTSRAEDVKDGKVLRLEQ